MLVLTRKTSEKIQIGDGITITVMRTAQGSVKLGIEAPPDVRIMRTELMQNAEAMTLPVHAGCRELVAN